MDKGSQIEGGKVEAGAVTTSTRLSPPASKALTTLYTPSLNGFKVSTWEAGAVPKGPRKQSPTRLMPTFARQ